MFQTCKQDVYCLVDLPDTTAAWSTALGTRRPVFPFTKLAILRTVYETCTLHRRT